MAIVLDGTSGITNDSGYTGDGVSFADSTPANTLVTTSGGNVGIGTSSPNKGGVSRALTLNGTAGNIVEFCVSDTRVGWVYGDNNLTAISAAGSRYLALETNGSERARINSSGSFMVGTTSGSADVKITAVASANKDAFYGEVPNVLNSGGTCYVGKISHAGSYLAYWLFGGSNVGAITSNGSNTSYGTSSDYRLKENIAPMVGALAKVAALKPRSYTWKLTGEADEGFIAHELQEVCPSAVIGEKDAVDAEGKPVYQGIDTSFLVATLTAALQEAHGLIKDLQARVDALEAK